ncbi:hypothetical protein BDV93DRAFT_560786 [Ceratobasidium sp. AG-I]|nr:hypothetical protein BDV93DRAFT_560786 [Ceratobasidium sp. AG-I]
MKYQAGYKSFPNPASTPAKRLPHIIVATPTEMWPLGLSARCDFCRRLGPGERVVSGRAVVLAVMIKEQGGGEEAGGVRPRFIGFECKLWCCGTVGAVVFSPLVTIQTRKNVQQVEAWTFFAGSVGSLITALWSMQVL